jgi:tetratricopeptide (TPR) repeat protein
MDEPITTPSQGVPRVVRTRPADPVRGPPPVVGQVAYAAPPAAPAQPAAAAPSAQPAAAPRPVAPKPPPVVSKPPAPSRPAVPPAPVRSNPPAPAPKPVAPPKPPAPGSLAALLRARENEAEADQAVRLQEALTRSDESTHFELLGLDRKATGAEVKKAFFVLARELHPDTVSSGHQVLRSLKERLFSKINEASQVLTDEKRRKEYEEELDGKANNVDIARIFAAEEAFQKGEIMIKARKYEAGLKLVEEAITLNDQEAEFYAWRGWARFLLAKDRKAQRDESVGDCKKAITMVPVCLPAWLFLANMAKTLSEPEAEKYYKKVLELDPKHVEAQRELRLMGAVKK